jgi:hypothetical protein
VTFIEACICATSDCTEVSGSPKAATAMQGLKAAKSKTPENTYFFTFIGARDGGMAWPFCNLEQICVIWFTTDDGLHPTRRGFPT